MALDFFISYTSTDQPWAVWIAWQLRAGGYEITVQDWDFVPGTSWGHKMQQATVDAQRTIAVLSNAYLLSAHGEAEWLAAHVQDPTGEQGKLVPVRVAECDPPGLLKARVYVDLVGLDEPAARDALLRRVRPGSYRPAREPAFPGAARPRFPPAEDGAGVDHESLLVPPITMAELDDPYKLGVDREAPQVEHHGYVRRDESEVLVEGMRAARGHEGAALVLISGPSKMGKTRLLYETAREALADVIVVAPRHAVALEMLIRAGKLSVPGDGPIILWLDDIEKFLRPDVDDLHQNPISAESFERLDVLWGRHVIVLATEGGKGHLELTDDAEQRLRSPVNALRRRADPLIQLAGGLSASERARGQLRGYSATALQQMSEAAVGEYMIAAPDLIDKLQSGKHPHESEPSRSGMAVVRAAIDWRLAGVLRPIPRDTLQTLHRLYLDGAPPSEERFVAGIEWAWRPLYETTRLLAFVPGELSGAAEDGYAPHDYIVDHTRRTADEPILQARHDLIVRCCSDPRDLFAIGLASHDGGAIDRAIDALPARRRAGTRRQRPQPRPAARPAGPAGGRSGVPTRRRARIGGGRTEPRAATRASGVPRRSRGRPAPRRRTRRRGGGVQRRPVAHPALGL